MLVLLKCLNGNDNLNCNQSLKLAETVQRSSKSNSGGLLLMNIYLQFQNAFISSFRNTTTNILDDEEFVIILRLTEMNMIRRNLDNCTRFGVIKLKFGPSH